MLPEREQRLADIKIRIAQIQEQAELFMVDVGTPEPSIEKDKCSECGHSSHRIMCSGMLRGDDDQLYLCTCTGGESHGPHSNSSNPDEGKV